MDRKPSPPSMCAMNMWCCTGFTGQSDCAGASKCSASTIRRLTITGAIPKLTRPRGWSSEPQGLSKMAANDHDNAPHGDNIISQGERSEEHTSELQSLMRISYAVFCLKKKKQTNTTKKFN